MMFAGDAAPAGLSPGLSQAADPRRARCTAWPAWRRYLVCNYLLYLRVSGQFHMACGMLHLFGFQLPETHHRYLLATSFTDYWRRINIYWKDFMVRVVFNPVVFRLKRWPQPAALAVGDGRGVPDHLAACTPTSRTGCGAPGASACPTPCSGASWASWCWSTSSSTRAGAGRRASRPVAGRSARLVIQALRVAGTFATIALLWSLWSSPSLAAWVDLLRRGLRI